MAYKTDVTDHWYFSDLLEYAEKEYGIEDDIRELLRKCYPPDANGELDDSDFDDSLGVTDPEFVIKIEGGDERCNYYSEDYFHVHLPNREAADELADILGGEITSDGTVKTGSKHFIVTYARYVHVYADSEAEALEKFCGLSKEELDNTSGSGKVISCVEDKEN